jgi:hypothetical protein
MERSKAIEILNEIIDEGWLISDMEKCDAIDACQMGIDLIEAGDKAGKIIARDIINNMVNELQLLDYVHIAAYKGAFYAADDIWKIINKYCKED